MTSASTYSAEAESRRPETEPPQMDSAAQAEMALNQLPQRQPPPLERVTIRHGREPNADEPIVIVAQTAVQQIADHSHSNLDWEVGGALLGNAYRHEGRVYVDVQAAVPAVTADQGPVHFTFTADAWAQLHKDRATHYPSLDIVGWFHTHPDLGVFYSSDDVVVHSAAFTMPWHVGLVVDPVRYESSFFGWRAGELTPLAGFYELANVQTESMWPWRAVATSVWDHPYGHAPQGERPLPGGVYLPPNGLPAVPALTPYLGAVLGGLGLLLTFFLLVAWVVPLTRNINHLQGAVLALADEALPEGYALSCPDPRLRILVPVSGSAVAAGSVIDFLGTAQYPDAARYQIDVRAEGVERWTLLQTQRRDVDLGQLVSWNTEDVLPGLYEVRLTAVDRNNIRLPGSPACVVGLQLAPASP